MCVFHLRKVFGSMKISYPFKSVEGTANPRLEILNECVMCSVCRRGGCVYSTHVFKGGRGDRQMRQKARVLTLFSILTSSARG